MVLLAENDRDLQDNLRILQQELKGTNMNISTEKTKVIKIRKTSAKPMRTIRLNGKIIERVESFKYLGAHLQENGFFDHSGNNRTNRCCMQNVRGFKRGFLNRREVSKGTKMAVYKSTFLPILTYFSESWILDSRNKSRIPANEMRYLRKVEGKTRRDRICNTTITANLETRPAGEKIEINRWLGHL